ncbi:MAG TPA: carboxylesterase family protein [Bryobacteraceae bacterium]|jgi:para-nitrobenzyl esterase|nr:carboxylesterase family protein [Bryobacteraceae bacterium]
MTSRRSFLAALGAGYAVANNSWAQSEQSSRAVGTTSNPELFFTADTQFGKVQGMANAGIKEFKGIPYGAPTAGKNRYMPPKKPSTWMGVRECFAYGQISPQTISSAASDYGQLIQWDLHYGTGMGEDVLTLNVWTPGIKDGVKRAVLVSFHGGGFATGSGNGPQYDGTQLARLADVVVVNVNHRLASLGYLHLADLGAPPEFAYAGVVGMMDLVASLEWVRDNIENFGGDPSKVMIFGQSGGGAKTSTMLAIPSAKGLFHAAGIQSGSTIRSATREQATKSTELLLGKLGIAKGNVADIQKLPWQQILEAQTLLGGNAAFTPVVDGAILPHHPFDPAAPPESADVPIIISNTLEDAALRLTNFDLTEEGLRTMMAQRYGTKAEPMLALYRNRYPHKSPFLIQAQIDTDSGARRSALLQAERKAAPGKAPAYMYLWEFASTGFGGKFGAVHGTDVSATFNNYRDGVGGTGSEEERALWSRFANTWVAMAKNANPNNSKIPNWPAYDAKSRATMIFDKEVRVENDPRSEIRKFWAEMPRA